MKPVLRWFSLIPTSALNLVLPHAAQYAPVSVRLWAPKIEGVSGTCGYFCPASYLSLFFHIFTFSLKTFLFPITNCRFAAWQRGFPWNFANCVRVHLNLFMFGSRFRMLTVILFKIFSFFFPFQNPFSSVPLPWDTQGVGGGGGVWGDMYVFDSLLSVYKICKHLGLCTLNTHYYCYACWFCVCIHVKCLTCYKIGGTFRGKHCHGSFCSNNNNNGTSPSH